MYSEKTEPYNDDKMSENEPFFSAADKIDKNLGYAYSRLLGICECICGRSDSSCDKTPIERKGVNGFMRDTIVHTNDICYMIEVIAKYFGC